MTKMYFTLTTEQVGLLGLDAGTWWGFLLGDGDDRFTLVTRDEEARDLIHEVVEENVRPPTELEQWAAAQTLDIPGWPEDW